MRKMLIYQSFGDETKVISNMIYHKYFQGNKKAIKSSRSVKFIFCNNCNKSQLLIVKSFLRRSQNFRREKPFPPLTKTIWNHQR